jgi:hypothetical protein
VTEAGRGDAVELAEGAVCGLVEHGNGVLGEEIALDASEADTDAEIVESVLGGGRVDLEPAMEAGEEGAIALQLETFIELGEADKHEREQSPGVPRVVEQDVEVIERVLVEQVRLVEDEDGMHTGLGQLLDVGADRIEDSGGGGRWAEAERETQLPVEVAASEGRIVAVGEAKAIGRDAGTCRAQDAGLADARLAGDRHALASLDGLDELVDDVLLRGWQPEVLIGELLASCQKRSILPRAEAS